MLEANEGLENIFENAVKEAEKRKHEYVTIEHVLLSLIKGHNDRNNTSRIQDRYQVIDQRGRRLS